MGRPRKPKPPEPTDDEIRKALLAFLYDRHKNARSDAGAHATMGDVKKGMKGLGVLERRIVSNLMYLVQTRWVEEKREQFNVYQKGRPVSVPKIRYRISAAGIDRLEGPSAFQQVDRTAGINITNVQGVTVVGQGNIVNARFEALFRDLDALGIAIRAADIPDADKVAYQAEIDTIKSQLAKGNPDKGILQRAWDAVKGAATVQGALALFDRVRSAIEPLLG